MAPAVFIFLVTLVTQIFSLTRLNKRENKKKRLRSLVLCKQELCTVNSETCLISAWRFVPNTEVVSGEHIRHFLTCIVCFFYMAHSFGEIYEIISDYVSRERPHLKSPQKRSKLCKKEQERN